MVYVGVCLACVFPKSFIVSGLTFSFLIHFEFIFVYGVRSFFSFFFFSFFLLEIIVLRS